MVRKNERNIRFSDSELAVVKEKAAAARMPVARFVRKMAVEGEIKIYDMNDTVNLMRSFNAIGTNLNQIAKVVNSTGEVYKKDIEEMREMFEYFHNVMNSYLRELLPKEILR